MLILVSGSLENKKAGRKKRKQLGRTSGMILNLVNPHVTPTGFCGFQNSIAINIPPLHGY